MQPSGNKLRVMKKISPHRKETRQPGTDDDVWPKVLLPKGRSTIGRARIRAAVRAVLARKNA